MHGIRPDLSAVPHEQTKEARRLAKQAVGPSH